MLIVISTGTVIFTTTCLYCSTKWHEYYSFTTFSLYRQIN